MSERQHIDAAHRRLAFVEVALEGEPSDRVRRYHEDEARAWQFLLQRAGLFDEVLLERRKRAVRAKVVPVMERRRTRVREALRVAREHQTVETVVDALTPRTDIRESAKDLVAEVQRTARVA